MSYLRTFAPWILYAAVSSASKQWAALGALVLAIVVIARKRQGGSSTDALIIEAGSAVFFVAFAALAFAAPHSGLLQYAPALSSGALAVIAWISLAIRRPFTMGIAKQSVPEEFWNQPAFIRTNVIITSVWAAAFTISSAILVLTAHDGIVTTIVQVAGFVVPMIFTIRYAAIVRARAAAQAA
jgi:hypothetical protein